MRVAVVGAEGGGLLQAVAEDGTPQGPPEPVRDLPAAVAERERAGRPRWVWAATPELYSALLAAGVRVDRGHDLTLTEGILLAADGRWGEPRSLPAAWARLQGLPVPEDTTRAAGGVADGAGSGGHRGQGLRRSSPLRWRRSPTGHRRPVH